MREIGHAFVIATGVAVLLACPHDCRAQVSGLPSDAGRTDARADDVRGASTQTTSATPDWLEWLNAWRDAASLPPVVEDVAASADARLHAQYCVRNGVLVHDEDDDNPWRTVEGDRAGNAGNVAVHSGRWVDDRDPIDTWIRGPFHAIGILDPALASVGYGLFTAPGTRPFGAAATLDVLRGRTRPVPPSRSVRFPADGAVVPFPEGCHGGACYPGAESPNPLTACPAYFAPTGLPVILQLGDSRPAPIVTATAMVNDEGHRLAHCVFTGASYVNPDPAQQALGRQVLRSRGAVVLVPRRPLPSGTSYTVVIVADGIRHAWSFSVVDGALPASSGGASIAESR